MQRSEPLTCDGEPIQGAIDDFHVTLEVFQGAFDLLLQLITRQRLDITEVSLAHVTDEFIAHMRAFPNLSRTTEFLVVAATLLEMKAAYLLPREIIEDVSSREDLEARDLLFSKLLQYRAFKEAAGVIGRRLEEYSGYYPREVPLEPHFSALLPELVWTTSAFELALIAAEVFSQTPEVVTVEHLHDPLVPVSQQVDLLSGRLRKRGRVPFDELIDDALTRATVVSRFLAILELYRRELIECHQEKPGDRLILEWIGSQAQAERTQ